MTGSAFFLFAPKFDGFGVDVARATAAKLGLDRIDGLVTGNRVLLERVRKGLGDLAGELTLLADLERDWLRTEPAAAELRAICKKFGVNAYNDIVSADRRVGLGYVRDGRTRPDPIGQAALAEPARVPRAYVAGLTAWVDAVLERRRPAVVFCYAVSGAAAYTLGIGCRARGVPFAQFAATRVGSGYVLDPDPCQQLVRVAARFRGDPAALEPWMEPARAHLRAFRAQPEMPEYQQFSNAHYGSRAIRAEIGQNRRRAAVHWLRARLTGDREARTRYERKLYNIDTLRARADLNALDLHTLDALLRPLPHYRNKSYLVFEGSRVVASGIWTPRASPLSRAWEVSEAPAKPGR